MLTLWDPVLLLVLAVALPIRAYLGMKHLRAAAASDLPRLRPLYHARGIAAQWLLVALLALLWASQHRTLTDLSLVPRFGFGLAGVLVGTLAIVIAVHRQMANLAHEPELMQRVRERLEPAAQLLPGSAREWPRFATFAVTAGICEELLFRGFVQWALAQVVGLWAAAALQVVLFGVAHAYQGVPGMLRTGFVGAFLTAVVLISGSLYPAMLLHALMDLQAGRLALRLRESGAPLGPA